MYRWILILALVSPAFAQQSERVMTPGFIALNTASIGAAAVDVALTQRCIRSGECHETNPLMEGGAARQYGLALSMAGAGTFISYEMKRHGSRGWMLAPIVSIAGHGVGIGLGLRF